MVEVICFGCGKNCYKELKKVNYAKKHNQSLFCSLTCYNQFRSRSVKANCANCGVEITKIPSDFKKSKTGDVFCSKSCATSLNNRRYKTGESHPNFADMEYRTKALTFYKPKCEICGYSTIECLQIQHINGNRKDNRLENLVVLCPTHHVEVHKGIIKVRENI